MPHRIRDFETFTVELPIEAPLRHSYAVHSAFKRTLLCLTTEDGLSGWGETAAPERLLREFRSVVVGEDPFHLEKMSMRISESRKDGGPRDVNHARGGVISANLFRRADVHDAAAGHGNSVVRARRLFRAGHNRSAGKHDLSGRNVCGRRRHCAAYSE